MIIELPSNVDPETVQLITMGAKTKLNGFTAGGKWVYSRRLSKPYNQVKGKGGNKVEVSL